MINTIVMSYTQDKLIELALDGLESLKKKDIPKFKPPNLKYKDRKTRISNFIEVCKSFGRGSDAKELDHIKDYLVKETNLSMSFDSGGSLVVVGSLRMPMFKKHITGYCNEYVKCKTCNSYNTDIVRKAKLYYISCNRCKQMNCIEGYRITDALVR